MSPRLSAKCHAAAFADGRRIAAGTSIIRSALFACAADR
jgi:hypothetical protein